MTQDNVEIMSDRSPNNDALSTGRIETLVDGVFAIVLTLLVLEIHAPEGTSETQLIHQLLALYPKLISFAISFVILGIFWFGHRMEYHYIRRSDRILIWLNLLFLMCITFIPFSASLLGENLEYRTATIVYGFNLIAAGVVRYIHWRYATDGHRLVDLDMDVQIIHKVGRIFLVVPFIYLFTICLSFLSITISLILYALVPALYIRPPREDRHLTSLRRQRAIRKES